MNPASALPAQTTIAVIGAGRLGGVLARALREFGFTVYGPLRRDEAIPTSEIALLCVPDAAIADAATPARASARLIGHVSGATGLDGVDFSIHPLQTFTGTESPSVFHGIGVAIDGRTDADKATAEHLAAALGARPFRIDDAHRATYHAAASFASNFVLTVLDAAERLADVAGIPNDHARELLAPLIRQTVDNWQTVGAAAALTGPIARGDEATVSCQRSAVAETTDLEPLFEALATATRAIVMRPQA